MAKYKHTTKNPTQNAQDYIDSLNNFLSQGKRDLMRREQNEIMKVYRNAYSDMVGTKLAQCGNDPKKIDRLTKAYASQLYYELESIVTKYNADMASTIETMQGNIMMSMNIIKKGEYYDFEKAVGKVVDIANREIVEQMIRGKIYNDNKGLDERLWNCCNASGQKLNQAIMSCIAQGQGAAEMSKTIKEFATGGHRTWDRKKIKEKLGDGYARSYGSGGLDYESLRLARTTITHQAQIATLNTQKINPYMNGVKWHSDHQAGRTCAECIARNGTVYNINTESVPLDHPNGGCWLEPIYMINGKEATVEEIAQDMKKWALGEPNSGLMNTVPEYREFEGSKKPKNKPSNGLIYTGRQRRQRYQQFKQELQHILPDMGPEYSVDDLLSRLQQAPLKVQDMYLSIGKLEIEDINKKGAYYSPGDKKIHISLRDEHNNKIHFGPEHRYDVLFHEWGHLIDNQWKTDVGKTVFKRCRMTNNLTLSSQLTSALEKDMNAWMENWKATNMPGKKVPEPLVRNKFKEFLNENEKHMIAIQDGIRGITNGVIQTKWGHKLDYYTRNTKYGDIQAKDSVHIEVSSELWAEVNAGMMHEDTRNFLETNFPNLVEEYNKQVDKVIKTYIEEEM